MFFVDPYLFCLTQVSVA